MKKAPFVLLSLIALSLSACARADNSNQRQFGNDANYFLALRAAEGGEEAEAARLLKIARAKASPLVARRSAESLTALGSVGERVEAANFLAAGYDDEAALLAACRELFARSEFARVISLTDSAAPALAKNELVALRLKSLAQKKDSRFLGELYEWFVSRPLSGEHLDVYQTYLAHLAETNRSIQEESEKFQKSLNKRSLLESQLAPDYQPLDAEGAEPGENPESPDSGTRAEPPAIVPEGGFAPLFDALEEAENPEKTVIDFRIAVYRRSYAVSFPQVDKIFAIYKNRGEEVGAQLLSDIGKSTLYGTGNYYASARKFDSLAAALPGESKYFAHFYAARLYDKAGRYPRQVVSRFRSALAATEDPLQFDNCLWYLLNFQLRTSTDDIISTLTEYGPRIHDPEYFDDFFESLSILLLSSHRWQDFFKVWKKTGSNFSDYTAGKYAYISGRLIEEGLAQGDDELKTRQTVDAYMRVLNGGASLYYKVCAIERLNVTDTALIDSYLRLAPGMSAPQESAGANADVAADTDAGKLLRGYAAFGFPARVYPEWLANRKILSLADALEASAFLSRCAEAGADSSYNVQSLRIASRAFGDASGTIPRELAERAFPKLYKPIIEGACEEFSVPPHLMFALVRSESFFDAAIMSKAGANGLTQLMETTAADEAKRLKLGDYDIFDPETNVRMGTHYLASLIGRTADNNKLLALYAYNAGLTNVRNWVTRFKRDWAATGKPAHKPVGISMDLFLESLPFAETREYGRKVISAAAMYAYLYEGKLPGETVREIMY